MHGRNRLVQMGFMVFFLLIIVLLVIPGLLIDAAYVRWRKRRIGERKSVSREIDPFWVGHVIVALLVGSILVLTIYGMLANPDRVSWNDLWKSLGGTLFLFLVSGFFYLLTRWEDPEIEAERYRFFGKYIFGGPKSWEFRIKYIPIYLLIIAGTFFLVSSVVFVTLLLR